MIMMIMNNKIITDYLKLNKIHTVKTCLLDHEPKPRWTMSYLELLFYLSD